MIKLNTCLNNKHRFVLLSKLQFRQENDNTMAKQKPGQRLKDEQNYTKHNIENYKLGIKNTETIIL